LSGALPNGGGESDSLANTTTPNMKPWGYLATLIWGVLIFVAAQLVGLGSLWLWYGGHLRSALAAEPYNGVAVTLVTLVTNPVEIACLMGVAALVRWDPAEYLGFVAPRAADIKLAIFCVILFIAAGDLAIYLAGQQVVPPFETEAYETAKESGWLPALAFATIIAAPIGEEALFRGFLFRGWVRSKRGALIAIPVISVIFAALHVQYDIFGITQIFGVGLLFGWLRWRSGSTLLTIGCHAFLNLESSIETAVKVIWFS
jgi:uncharacterized protein